MKRFFFFIFSVLLNTCVFAQSVETPLKGDVNEDGKVDVADINAVIQIMKDAGGTFEVPVEYIIKFYNNINNSRPIETIQGPIGTRINRPQYTRTGFTLLGWNTDQNAITTINIPNTIQANMPFNNDNTVNYYWYVGGTQPTSINESTWKKSTTDAPFTTTATATPGSDGYVWCAFPSNWNYDITDSAGFGVAFGFLPASIKNSISGYTIYRLVQDGSDTWTFKFTK